MVGGAWSSLSLLVPQLYTLLVSVSVARTLGPELMGIQSFISFVQFSLFLILANGVPSALTRFVGEALGRRRPFSVHLLLGWAWRAQVAGAVVGSTILLGVALTRSELQAAWMLAAVTCGLSVLHAVPASLLVGMQRWRDVTVVGLTVGGVAAVTVTAALLAGGGITAIFAVEAAAGSVSLVWITARARRALTGIPRDDVPEHPPTASPLRRDMFRYAGMATVQGALHLVVWRRSEFFFLARSSPASELAVYSIAFAATTALLRLPQSLATVLLPAVATLFGAGETDRIRAGSQRALRLLITLSLPMATGGIALGPVLLQLVYGDEYRRAGVVIAVLLAVFPLVPLYHLASGILQGVGRIKPLLAVNAVAGVVTLTLSALLVPRHGALGAAVANALAQATGSILALRAARRVVPALAWTKVPDLWRPIAAAFGTGGAALASLSALGSGVAGLSVGVVAGVAAFAGLAVVLRIVSPEDAMWLRDHAGSRFGGMVARLCRPFLPEEDRV